MIDNAVPLKQLLSPKSIAEIDEWIAKYPSDQKQSAVMSALLIAQKEMGYLTIDLMDAVAQYLEMAPIAVYEVASFYSMYEHKPVGRHIISICTNISCKLQNCAATVNYLEKKLNITLGATTTDNRFTLRSVECLGACVNAPMMQIDNDYHEHLTPEKIDQVLEQYP